MCSRRHFERDGTGLSVCDYGGAGVPLVLLHGLAGHGGEWADTARAQVSHARVLAPDGRGHGSSERFPRDVSRQSHVDDVAFLIEQFELGPVVLVGHSLGGVTAMLVAAERPDLLKGLVVVEAGPAEGTVESILDVEEYLSVWPTPFDSRDAAERFFGGPSLRARRWADGLEQRDDGLWPMFDREVIGRTLRSAVGRDCWDKWNEIRSPALVVRAEQGTLPAAEAAEMLGGNLAAELVVISGAGHDLHLDRPGEWNRALAAFLDALRD